MYLYFMYVVINIYGAMSAAVSPSILQVIEHSKHDPKYKCSNLRTSKLLENVPDILKNCPDFQQAQSLTQVVPENVVSALCILYYNNFENLCYVMTNSSVLVKLEDSIPNVYKNNIEAVCKTLINNTHFVQNAKPGIDTVTQGLRGLCNRMCTDFYSNVKPICSLSAYITYVGTEVDRLKKAKKSISTETELEKQMEKSPPIELSKEDVPKENEKQKSSPIYSIPESQVPMVGHKGISAALIDQLHAKTNTAVDDGTNTKQITNAQNPEVAEFDPSINKEIQTSIEGIPTVASKSASIELVTKSSEHENGAINAEIVEAAVSKVKADTPNENKDPIADNKESNVDLNNKPSRKKVQQVEETANEPDNSHIALRVDPEHEVNLNKDYIKPHNADQQQESTLDKNAKSQKSSSEKPIKHADLENVDVLDIGNKIKEQQQGFAELGREGDELPEINSENEGEADRDNASPGDRETEYEIDVVPKSSEVKAKVPEVPIRLTEKLKPLHTDEDEHYSVSANFQNQNIDDSDSYFFSYFMMFCIIFICGYVAYHNKQKILALVVEGRRSRRPSRSRRPNSANYHKLDSNLEEAVTSTCNKKTPQVIY